MTGVTPGSLISGGAKDFTIIEPEPSEPAKKKDSDNKPEVKTVEESTDKKESKQSATPRARKRRKGSGSLASLDSSGQSSILGG